MDKVVHFEIEADDLNRAEDFYKQVFGWGINKVPMGGGVDYYIIHTAKTDDKGMIQEMGAINGGMFKRSGKGYGPVIVIDVANLDETLKKIEAKGGTIVSAKQTVGDMGLYARVKDSEGNIIGVWEDLKK